MDENLQQFIKPVLNLTPGSQDQTVCSQSFQISNIITVVITQNTYTPSYFFRQRLSEPLLPTKVHPLALDYGIAKVLDSIDGCVEPHKTHTHKPIAMTLHLHSG